MDIVERLQIDFWREGDPDLKEAADEIERLRGQVEFERTSLRSAFDELLERDNEIERLREALQDIADFSLYGDYSNAYEMPIIATRALAGKIEGAK